MELKGFIIYPYGGIIFALNNFGHNQYPPNSLDQNNLIHGVYKYLHEGNAFLLGFVKAMQYPFRIF
jgi:hypothetical protein